MTRVYITPVFCLLVKICFAQTAFYMQTSTKKLDLQTYEVHVTLTATTPWHVYAQSTPEGGPVPTSVQFKKTPEIFTKGKVKEVGMLVKTHEKVFSPWVHFFVGTVDFVQIVTGKGIGGNQIDGEINFMMGDGKICLPPITQTFSITLPK